MEIILYYLLKKQNVKYYRYYKRQYLYCFALLVFFSSIINMMEYDTPFFHLFLLIELAIFLGFFHLVYRVKKINNKLADELWDRCKNNGYLTFDEFQYIKLELKKQSIQLDDTDRRIKRVALKINKQL